MGIVNKLWIKHSLLVMVTSTVSWRVGEHFFEVSPITASSVTLGIAIGFMGVALNELNQKLSFRG